MSSFFTNTDGPIFIKSDKKGDNTSLPYPSIIKVPSNALAADVTSLAITFTQLTTTENSKNLGFLLIAPEKPGITPRRIMSIFTGAGTGAVNNLSFVITDAASNYATNALQNGQQYKPTQVISPFYYGGDDLNIPPVSPYANPGPVLNGKATLNGIFVKGFNPRDLEGDWELYAAIGDNSKSSVNNKLMSWTLTFNYGNTPPFPQNFDLVGPPFLPGGWIPPPPPVPVQNPPVWSTSNTQAYAPNPIPPTIEENIGTLSFLVSPMIDFPVLAVGGSVLTFDLAYDIPFQQNGMVLEISNNGGSSFIDILAEPSNATFSMPPDFPPSKSAPYNGKIMNTTNLLDGKMAWTGNSRSALTADANGVRHCVVFLSNSFVSGKTIMFRWAFGTAVGQSGWGVSIDNVTVQANSMNGYKNLLDESFNNAIPPSLPVNWSMSTDSTPAFNWVTKGPAPSSPNTAFIPDVPGTNTTYTASIITPTFIPDLGTRMSFDLSYDTWENVHGLTLEYSTDGSTTKPIESSQFLTGSYNGTVSATGEDAWTGFSNGFLYTEFVLPDDTAGQFTDLYFTMIYGTLPAFSSLSRAPRAIGKAPGFGVNIGNVNLITPNICILPGAVVVTNTGGIKIENLKKGDMIIDETGKEIEVLANYACRMNKSKSTVCFRKNSLGPSKPNGEIRITHDHPIKANAGDAEQNVQEFVTNQTISNKSIRSLKQKADFMYTICTKERAFVNINNIFVGTWDMNDFRKHLGTR